MNRYYIISFAIGFISIVLGLIFHSKVVSSGHPITTPLFWKLLIGAGILNSIVALVVYVFKINFGSKRQRHD